LTYAQAENLNKVGRLWPLAVLAGLCCLPCPASLTGGLLSSRPVVVRGGYRRRTTARATRHADAVPRAVSDAVAHLSGRCLLCAAVGRDRSYLCCASATF